MKNILLMPAALTAMLLFGVPVHAMSVDHRDTTNDDGTPKFADPDEQTPPFMIMPETESGSGGTQSYYPSITHQNAPGMPDASRQGEESFDRAYSHLQGNQ